MKTANEIEISNAIDNASDKIAVELYVAGHLKPDVKLSEVKQLVKSYINLYLS